MIFEVSFFYLTAKSFQI